MPRKRVVVKITAAPADSIAADALALLVTEEDLRGRGSKPLAALDTALDGNLLAAARAESFAGKPGQELVVTTVGKLPARRVHLLGLGPRERAAADASRGGHEPVRFAVGRAARAAVKARARVVAVVVPELLAADVAGAARAMVEGALLGAYSFDRYRKPDVARPSGLGTLVVAVPPAAERSPELREAVGLAREVADAVAWARDLVNLGPADCTPIRLAAAASELARGAGLAVKVRGPREIEALGMGLFLGVSRGSAEPPRLVQVSYQPRGAARRRPLVLVGKAITFDSGGLSLKPTDVDGGHEDRHGRDARRCWARCASSPRSRRPSPCTPCWAPARTCPAAAPTSPCDVLRASRRARPWRSPTPTPKVGWCWATCSPGPPGASSRRRWSTWPRSPAPAWWRWAHYIAGLFGHDGKVVEAVLEAARTAGEDVWRMPLTEVLEERSRASVADMKNTGERWGGAINAAHFLKEFVGDTPWVHLDIAGPSHAPRSAATSRAARPASACARWSSWRGAGGSPTAPPGVSPLPRRPRRAAARPSPAW